jgi:hypothetical protein
MPGPNTSVPTPPSSLMACGRTQGVEARRRKVGRLSRSSSPNGGGATSGRGGAQSASRQRKSKMCRSTCVGRPPPGARRRNRCTPPSGAGGTQKRTAIRRSTFHSAAAAPSRSITCSRAGGRTPGPGSTSKSMAAHGCGMCGSTTSASPARKRPVRPARDAAGNHPDPKWMPDPGGAMSSAALARRPSAVRGNTPSRAHTLEAWRRSARYMRFDCRGRDARNSMRLSGKTVSAVVHSRNSPLAARMPALRARRPPSTGIASAESPHRSAVAFHRSRNAAVSEEPPGATTTER